MDLINYSFNKYQDQFYIYNSDPGTISYVLSIQQNCSNYVPVSSGVVPTTTTTLGTMIPLPTDGDYQIVLTRGSSQTTTITFRNYLQLQQAMLYNFYLAICGIDCNCKDCNEEGLDDCFFYKPLFNQVLGYQFLIKPYEGDYCESSCLFDSYLDQALNANRCQIYADIYNQLCFQSMGTIADSSKDALMYILTIYYLAFYYFERLKAADAAEQAYIDAKFYWSSIQLCIKKAGIDITSIQSIYQATSSTCNTAPTVNNVQLYFSQLTDGESDQVYTFKTSDFTTGFSDAEGDLPNNVMILSNVFSGQLKYNNQNIDGENFVFNIANVALLQYVYTIHETEDLFDKIFFQISDNNATPKYSNMATISMTVNAYVNQGPSAVGNNALTIANRSTYVFTLADFTSNTTPPYADPEGDPPAAVKIITLPASGSGQIVLVTTPVTAGQVIPVSAINAGSLKFVSPDQNPEDDTSFTFAVSDAGSGTFRS